jgi:DNA polymerase III sliding clamp (beta) subunit (PCNA family)
LRIVAATRHRNVSQATIDELLSALLGIHMDKHAVSSLSLAAVTRHRVAMIEMRILPNVERDRSA